MGDRCPLADFVEGAVDEVHDDVGGVVGGRLFFGLIREGRALVTGVCSETDVHS